jgi:hypothetical protein
MNDFRVWGLDWSLATGTALAWRGTRGELRTVRLGIGAGPAAKQLDELHMVTGQAALAALEDGTPTAVYFEQAYARNERGKRAMYSAEGVLQAALWNVLRGRTPYEPNVWPIRTVEWRAALGLKSPRPDEGSESQRRAIRKQQQKTFAIGLGAHAGLSEDEFDSACILRAGELDIGEDRRAA